MNSRKLYPGTFLAWPHVVWLSFEQKSAAVGGHAARKNWVAIFPFLFITLPVITPCCDGNGFLERMDASGDVSFRFGLACQVPTMFMCFSPECPSYKFLIGSCESNTMICAASHQALTSSVQH